MSVFLSPVFNDTQVKDDGTLAVGYKIYTYVAGSVDNPLTTYTTADGDVPQSNPIVLNARGETDDLIWLTGGLSYKLVLTTDADVVIRTEDDIAGVNDSTITLDQWVASGLTPTYVNATQFTLSGDQTTAFHVNRRLKLTVTSGTVYGYISASAYTSSTTITVVLDSGTLDAGLSTVQLGLITPNNTSLPLTQTAHIADDAITTAKIVDEAVTKDKLADGAASGLKLGNKIQPITAAVDSNALTVTLNPTTLDFRSATLTSGTINTRTIESAISVVVSSGSTLGTISTVLNRLAVLAIDNAGTVELAVVNLSGGVGLDETGVISTTAEGGAGGADSATSIYSTTARSNVAYRVVGFIESTQTTAGTWATAPSKIQGVGGQVIASLASIGYGQTWQDVSGSRSVNTTYYNLTGKPIEVSISCIASSGNPSISCDSVVVGSISSAARTTVSFTVPPWKTYIVGTNTTIFFWSELR